MIFRILRRLGVLPNFDDDDMINASIEDKVRDVEKVLAAAHRGVTRRYMSNERLRQSIRTAQVRSTQHLERSL